MSLGRFEQSIVDREYVGYAVRETNTLAPSRHGVLTRSLLGCAVIVLLASFAARLHFVVTEGTLLHRTLAVLYSLNLDERLSECLLGIAALLLVINGVRGVPPETRKAWWALAAVVGVAFAAKSFGLVGLAQAWTRSFDSPAAVAGLYTSSLISFGVAAVLLMATALFLLPELRALQPAIQRRMVLAAALFVTGFLGIEAVSEWCWTAYGGSSLPYAIATVIEESFETAGLIVFVTGLVGLPRVRSARLAPL